MVGQNLLINRIGASSIAELSREAARADVPANRKKNWLFLHKNLPTVQLLIDLDDFFFK